MFQEQNSEENKNIFAFREKKKHTHICLNVFVPWVTWMPEASGLTAFRRITFLALMTEEA